MMAMLDKAQNGTVASYLVARLEELGIEHLFNVSGSYCTELLAELAKNSRLKAVFTTYEMEAAYAADAYARIKGYGAMCGTYGVAYGVVLAKLVITGRVLRILTLYFSFRKRFRSVLRTSAKTFDETRLTEIQSIAIKRRSSGRQKYISSCHPGYDVGTSVLTARREDQEEVAAYLKRPWERALEVSAWIKTRSADRLAERLPGRPRYEVQSFVA
jgi:hypothetical protein